VEIADDTDAIPTCPVYGNDCLHAQLVLVRDVKQPGINRARCRLILIEIARFGFKKLNSVMGTKRFTKSGKPRSSRALR
jgi:hypothetical protein